MARSESPATVPQQTKLPLVKAEIIVLQAHLEDWRSVKGKQRHLILKAVHKEACLQAPTQDKALLKAQKKTYKEWLYNQCSRKAPKPLVKYGKKWTAHCVLIEQNKARIREETGEMPGSEAMIAKWPEATKTVLAGLSAEEKEEANVLADKWNNEAAPHEVQANLAETKGADMIEHFTTEMFKQAGMRVFVMSAWRDSRGKLMLGAHDHNNQFGGGESFMKTRNWDEIFMLEWRQYAGEQFNVKDDDAPQVVTSKKRMPRKLLDLEEDNDGLPMLSDTLGLKRGEQQHVIRSFLTKHYRMCMGTEKVKVAVPWGDLIKNQYDFFDGAYWPADVQVVEPSKIDKAGATALLDFWYDRQQKKLPPTFCFKAWKDTDGKMEPPAKAYQKVIRRLSSRRRNKAHNAPKATKASKHVLKHLQDSEESLDDREEYESSDDGEEAISSRSKVREQPPPASIIHSSTTSAKPPASKAAKAEKEPALVQTTRSGKRRTAPPISDMPVKRTRSKVAIVEPPKPRRGRK
ncbi:hypothetical protein EV702DRAFT_1198306 [Suillus placidus]|uniref:Uncharacterized protein n=1 Tax=Suillus placidus TaxID=48579 RepID=A0A9P7D2Q5_9AGAM|nr:hypothetical protein EV702DRAFT_1198306 [Suillus placidus]